MPSKTLSASLYLAGAVLASAPAVAKDVRKIGVSVGSLDNPYFTALVEGATNRASTRSVSPKPSERT